MRDRRRRRRRHQAARLQQPRRVGRGGRRGRRAGDARQALRGGARGGAARAGGGGRADDFAEGRPAVSRLHRHARARAAVARARQAPPPAAQRVAAVLHLPGGGAVPRRGVRAHGVPRPGAHTPPARHDDDALLQLHTPRGGAGARAGVPARRPEGFRRQGLHGQQGGEPAVLLRGDGAGAARRGDVSRVDAKDGGRRAAARQARHAASRRARRHAALPAVLHGRDADGAGQDRGEARVHGAVARERGRLGGGVRRSALRRDGRRRL
mmetsp:Transcript_14962/g.52075  ORF Transcript_14962/g.52075 Transcript_14962/m.52075 type:complete len:267 (+) Transcript_14962:232-1032(+)